MRKHMGLGLAIAAMLALQGCAHGTTEQKLDDKLAREAPVKNQTELRSESDRLLETAPGLSEGQRLRLRTLRDSTREQSDTLRAQSLKLRATLIEDMVSSDYNAGEVKLIKKRIRSVENKRLALLFDAVEQANSILGRQAAENPEVMHEFFGMAPHSQPMD